MNNKEEMLKCKLHYYSERGMVNALCYSLYGYKYARIHFLKTIKKKDGNRLLSDEKINGIKGFDIFNEFSFGGFGDPDLILKLTYDNDASMLFFIEAKVGKYSQSASKAIEDGYKNNASKINFQLNLKKRFIKVIQDADEIISPKINESDYDRKLKKQMLIRYINKIIVGNTKTDNIYYVSMTSDKDNPYKDAKLPFENDDDHLCYILYDSFYGQEKYEPNYKGIRSECVLYGNTYKMFEDAYKLANNEEVEE